MQQINKSNIKMEIGRNTDEIGSVIKPFQCTICPKTFLHESSLENHILNKHVEDKEFQCKACLETKQLVKSFATEHFLNKHIQRVHDPPRFKCQVCFKTFYQSTHLTKHKRKHSQANLQMHKCDLCSQVYPSKYALQSHLFHVHKQKREGVVYYKCEICSREFLARSQLERHVVHQHVVDEAFECHVCSKKFIDQQALEKHMKRHDRQIEFFCDVCSQGYIKKESLIRHLGVKHTHFLYCDNKCLRSFKNKPDFDEHISDSKQELKCSICQELINSECNLKIHTNSHVKEIKTETKEYKIKNKNKPLETDTKFTPKSTKQLNSENFDCELCSKTFDREAYFKAHRMLVHPNAEWKCNFEACSKAFNKYNLLRLHKMEHAETKAFVCNICQKSFYRPDSLKDHEKVHLKEKRYKCEICPKSFTTPAGLRTHIANNHGGLKPFKCPVAGCGTFYANNSQLNGHLVSHQTEKSFKCEICPLNKAFKTLKQLKIHQRRVHSETKKIKARASRKKTFWEAVVFICSSSACSFDTVNEKNVALHYNQQHGLPQVVLLRNISAPFAMSKQPEISQFKMRSIISKKYKCDICFKLFKSTYSFSWHTKVVHSNAIPFKCPVCSTSIKCKGNMTRHIKKFH